MMVAKEVWAHFVHNFDRYTHGSLVVEGADGYLINEQRHGQLLDMNAGYWCVPFGHDRELFRTVSQRASYFGHSFGRGHPPGHELATQLCRQTGYERLTFGASGSEAIDAAIRMVQQSVFTTDRKRTVFLCLEYGYHGSTSACLSVSGFPDRQLYGATSRPLHMIGRWVFDPTLTITGARAQLDRESIDWRSIVGFILEPIQGVAGARVVNPFAYQVIAERCHAEGALVIADEVTTGLGRFGQLLATAAWQPRPDIVCVGKAFAAGFYPLSATLITSEVYARLEAAPVPESVKWLYGGTFAGQPLGCAFGLETLRRLTPELLENVRSLGSWLGGELTALAATTPSIRRLSGRDLMWAISLSDQHEAEYRWQQLLQQGCLFGLEGRKLMLVPALTMPQALLQGALTALSDVLRRD